MLLYGSEAWTITAAEQKRLEAMETWCYRRMLKIKWTERITNEEVLRIVGEKRNIMITVRKRRGRFIGHILRHSSLLKAVLVGEISGKNYRGRPRMEYIGQIMNWGLVTHDDELGIILLFRVIIKILWGDFGHA
jgi:hypothetical protein